MRAFLEGIAEGYRSPEEVLYHNFSHAAQVRRGLKPGERRSWSDPQLWTHVAKR